jgi:hypothetical protein
MCGGHHEQHRSRGFRGFGRHGFPDRQAWLERLQGYQQHLEQELDNVKDVVERLGRPDAPEQI